MTIGDIRWFLYSNFLPGSAGLPLASSQHGDTIWHNALQEQADYIPDSMYSLNNVICQEIKPCRLNINDSMESSMMNDNLNDKELSEIGQENSTWHFCFSEGQCPP